MRINRVKMLVSTIIFFVLIWGYNFVNAESLPSKYDLRDHINIEVRDQMQTNTCWAFSASSMLSNHLSLLHNESYTFSPRHFEYVMSGDSILNYTNRYAYNTKTLDLGGTVDVVKQYLIQGTGPILEQNMPFENNYNPIARDRLPLDLNYKQVTEAAHILPLYKEWSGENLIYKDYKKNIMNSNQIIEYQNTVKSAIKEYGGVQAALSVDVNSFNPKNGAYNQKAESGYWHSILLIGWDDNYNKENFKENVRPINNGAYIAVNSWGNFVGDNGYMYISYEDVTIDTLSKLYVKKIENVDYDNIYDMDLISAKQNGETLTEISVMLDSDITGSMNLNLKIDGIDVIQNGIINDCIENFVLPNPVKLNENTSIVLTIEVQNEFKEYVHTYYHTITNDSQFEVGNLNIERVLDTNTKMYLYTRHNSIDNGKMVRIKILNENVDKTADFTVSGNVIKSNQTEIFITPKTTAENGNYVIQLTYNNKTITRSFSYNNANIMVGESGGEITSVKGDISLDGKVTGTDLSQIKAYLVKLLILDGERKNACDVNGNGNITTLDLSILKMILVGMN